jgi:hypothetical protein
LSNSFHAHYHNKIQACRIEYFEIRIAGIQAFLSFPALCSHLANPGKKFLSPT